MPMQRKSISHRHRAALSPREPSLTSVVGSLLGPILGESSGSGSSGGSSSSTSTTPTETASSSNGGGSGNSNGGGSGNGSGGGSGNSNGGGSGNGNGGGNGNGNGGGKPDGSGGSSSGPSSAIGNGALATPSANAGQGPGTPNPSALNGGGSVPSSLPFGSAASSTGTMLAGLGGSASGNSSSGQPTFPPSNVGESPPVGSGLSSSGGSPGSSGSDQAGSLGSGGTSGTGNADFGSTATPTVGTGVGATQNGLSSGAIAGIVIASLIFLLTLTLVLVRRRAVARRAQRFKWWLANNATSHSFSFVGVSSSSSHDSSRRSGGNRASVRSSFATNFDHGLLFRNATPTAELGIPELPPMAEVRDRNHALISTGGEAARRDSFASMASNGSHASVQYLIAPTDLHADTGAYSPMSVRPFSPSETFSFPKPPLPSSASLVPVRQGVGSPSASTATLVQVSPPPPVFHRELVSPPSPITELPPVPAIVVNPFEDPAPALTGTETIRRPFTPNMEDELLVSLGDVVRILQVFDDGWALVERTSVNTVVTGDLRSQQRRGLIPVDCFRESGQGLPHFLAQKRLTDYATPHGIRPAF
ncbi:hypothetical protein EDC04DRAFT_2647085 [Pisolithus marmoratus]|nr:hypothetical protein EDC04DRAFT_2647085 [Pisolithus marmoratus]